MYTIPKFIKILLTIVLFSNLLSTSFAVEQKLMTEQELSSKGFTKYESTNPDSLMYSLKRFNEKIKSFFIFNKEKKNEYNSSLLDMRFNELVYIINFKKTGFLAEAVNRYNSSVGGIKSSNISYNKDKLTQYITLLDILRDKYPANSAYWLYIQQTIDTTKSLL